MKNYLFGLGAMAVGAGLISVLMQGEVEAEGKSETFVCSDNTRIPFVVHKGNGMRVNELASVWHCQAEAISCEITVGNEEGLTPSISCVRN